MASIFLILFGYLLGSIPIAYIAAPWGLASLATLPLLMAWLDEPATGYWAVAGMLAITLPSAWKPTGGPCRRPPQSGAR